MRGWPQSNHEGHDIGAIAHIDAYWNASRFVAYVHGASTINSTLVGPASLPSQWWFRAPLQGTVNFDMSLNYYNPTIASCDVTDKRGPSKPSHLNLPVQHGQRKWSCAHQLSVDPEQRSTFNSLASTIREFMLGLTHQQSSSSYIKTQHVSVRRYWRQITLSNYLP